MTKQDTKIIMCLKWFLRLDRTGATDDEIIKAMECVLEHGDGIEILLMEQEIKKAIEYRTTVEYRNELYRRQKEIAEKVKRVEAIAKKLAEERHEVDNGET